jgi:hypothetical protein
MNISATQDETFTRCKRLWWFLYPQRMKQVMKGDLDFGTVIHEVCERYLLADDTGRVPHPPSFHGLVWLEGPLKGQLFGDEVELYPTGWATVDDKKGKRSIPPSSQDTIKRLVAKAIETGKLQRSPDRSIEHRIEREVIPGITMIGKIDVKLPGEIQDHKSTSSMHWAKSEDPKHWNYLGKSLQMLDYAYEIFCEEPETEEIRLRHNVFCKDPAKPAVRNVDTTVSRAVVQGNWRRLQKQAAVMRDLAEQGLEPDDWAQVEGPSQKDACGAYGGCPFRAVCSKLEPLQTYILRTEKQLENPVISQPSVTWEDKWDTLSQTATSTPAGRDNVDLFEQLAARKAASSSGEAPAPADIAIDGSALDTALVGTSTFNDSGTATDAPPWANPNCAACGGKGLNTKGSPCRICDATSKKAGGLQSIDFKMGTDGAGNVTWTAKDGSSEGSAPIAEETVEPKAQEKILLPEDPLDSTPPETEPVKDVVGKMKESLEEAQEEVEAPVVAKALKELVPEMPRKEKPKAAPRKRGRRKIGYMIYIDCMPIGVETVAIETLFTAMSAELAEQQKVESYFDLDVFKRREAFSRVIDPDYAAERFNKLHVVVRNPQGAPDIRAFVDAIVSASPPGAVIQGVR